MKICVIFTGGTIGSTLRDGYVNVNSKCSSVLLNQYPHICFEEKHPVSMLSENVSVEDLRKIIIAIRDAIEVGYDGIIVTHGTDTLCFTANVLSQVFANSPIPIALVSALLPLEDPKTNGFANFQGAVEFIRSFNECRQKVDLFSEAGESKRAGNAPRVFVSFKNGEEECRIHDAAYLLEAEEVTGYMYSFCDMYYGTVRPADMQYGTMLTGDMPSRFILNPRYKAPCFRNLQESDIQDEDFGQFLSKGCLSNEFLTIRSRALLNYKYYNFDFDHDKPKAVLIELYHSGTLCSVGDECNALRFIEKCRQKDIIVIIGPVKRGDNVYASMREISQGTNADMRSGSEDIGNANECIIAYDRSFELTVAQVSLALGAGAGYEEIKMMLK